MANATVSKLLALKSQSVEIERELFAQVAQLPEEFGCATMDELIALLKKVAAMPASSLKLDKPVKVAKAPKVAKAKAPKDPNATRKPRVKVTPEIVEKVKELTLAGKTIKEIAAVTGVSGPTVQNLKKKHGLVAS